MKTLTTDQMTTLIKTITIFIDNRDPFTTENIINELKRDGDYYNGFYEDNGNCIVDDLYCEIDDAIDSIIIQFFPDFIAEQRRVYIYEPKQKISNSLKEYDDEEEYDEIEDLNEDEEYQTDKEGNRIPTIKDYTDPTWPDTDEQGKPIENKSDKEDDEDMGAGWYKDPATGDWMWDRDAAETARMIEEDEFWEKECNKDNNETENKQEFSDYQVPKDHEPEYELIIDKNKRINIGKKILVKTVGYDENELVTVIAECDGTQFYIIRTKDLNWDINDNQWIVGEYTLKNGALRLGISTFIDNIEPGDVMYAKIHWPVMCTDDNILYIHIYPK